MRRRARTDLCRGTIRDGRPYRVTLPEIEYWCNHFLKCSALNAALNIVQALLTALTVMWIWWPNLPSQSQISIAPS